MIKVSNVEAFTRDLAAKPGNPALVIQAEGGVTDEVVGIIEAAECSVAVVVDEQFNVRFFYEHGKTETFACGHATLALGAVLFAETDEDRLVLTNAKGKEIELERFGDGKIAQEQPVPILHDVEVDIVEVLGALGLDEHCLNVTLPVQAAGAPDRLKLMIPITGESLFEIERDSAKIVELCAEYSSPERKLTGFFPFLVNRNYCDAHARHFPNRDIEDLVCGVGSLALALYLREHVERKSESIVISCGPGMQGTGDVIVRFVEEGRRAYLEGYGVIMDNS